MSRYATIATTISLLAFMGTHTLADESADPAATGDAAVAECCDACVKAASTAEDVEAERAQGPTDLLDVAPLRDRFNADLGHVRAVAVLSPVCPGCIKSADLIQSAMLKEYPDADFKLYVVWLPMVPGDARERWNPESLQDRRATHFWNQSRSIGKWFAKNVIECEPLGPVAWDVVYFFSAEAKWEGDELDSEFCPTPVFRYSDELVAHAKRYIGKL